MSWCCSCTYWVSFCPAPQGSTTLGLSSQAECCWLLFLMDRHTALLHLNPLPKAICQILSPFLMPRFDSMLDSTYLQDRQSRNVDSHRPRVDLSEHKIIANNRLRLSVCISSREHELSKCHETTSSITSIEQMSLQILLSSSRFLSKACNVTRQMSKREQQDATGCDVRGLHMLCALNMQ